MKKLALAEAEEASKQARQLTEAEAEKQALPDRLKKPSGVSDEEAIQRAIKIIERAVSNGRTEVQVHRFPNQLCTDKGRAINQQEPGWENTLTGVPKEIYQLWAKYFRPPLGCNRVAFAYAVRCSRSRNAGISSGSSPKSSEGAIGGESTNGTVDDRLSGGPIGCGLRRFDLISGVGGLGSQRPDCVAEVVGLEVRRETGKE